jgi:membrane fusion protein (multidrug efflux system)
MLVREKIDRTNNQADELRADVVSPNSSTFAHKASELRSEPREPPSITPADPAKRPDAIAAAGDHEPPPARSQRVRSALFALLPIAAAAGAYCYVAGGRIMSTDDAYVDADKVGISTDVSGIVNDVDVRDNQYVSAGQILYRLDPRQFRIALDNAKANLAQTALTIDAMKQDYKRMLSDAAAEQAQLDLDQINYNRASTLVRSGAVSQSTFDQANYTLLDNKSKLQSRQQQAATQLARLGGKPDIETTQHPQYLQVKAQVDEAQRELDHTVVRAPFAGTVTNVPSIAPHCLQPGCHRSRLG